MKTIADPPERDRWARLRFSIIGPLMAAPPAPRQLGAAFLALAAKTWRHPVSGLDVRFGASTLERWYYRARSAADPVAALKDELRGDEGGFPSLTPVAIAALTLQYREHPGWTAQLHLDNLRVACKEAGARRWPRTPPCGVTCRPRACTVRRDPKRATEGAVAARDRLEQLEVRSFEVEHVAALWHLDFHHASRKVLTRAGAWIKPMLLGVIDDRSRLVCHLQWYLDETAHSLVHGLSPGVHEARPAARADDGQRRGHAQRGGHAPGWPRWVSCTRRRCPTARTRTPSRSRSGAASRAG